MALWDENEKSLEFMQKGIILCEERDSHGNLCLMYRGLAELLTKMGKFDEALIELNKATNSCLKLDDEYQELVTVINIIDVLVTNSQFNEALEKSKNLRQSILKNAFEGKLLSKEELEKCKQDKDYEPASVLLEKIKTEKKNLK